MARQKIMAHMTQRNGLMYVILGAKCDKSKIISFSDIHDLHSTDTNYGKIELKIAIPVYVFCPAPDQ